MRISDWSSDVCSSDLIAEGSPQAVLILRHQHDVDMIGHQAIGPDLATRPLRRIGQQTEIEFIIPILEEGAPAPVAPLRHMVRDAGQDNARKTGPAQGLRGFGEIGRASCRERVWQYGEISVVA